MVIPLHVQNYNMSEYKYSITYSQFWLLSPFIQQTTFIL